MKTTSMILRIGVGISLCVFVASPAGAQECGDADGIGGVTVTDGVQVLRAASDLSSSCTVDVCDMDGNGAVTVTDGVNTLRKAADLPVVVDQCPVALPTGCPRYAETCTPSPLVDTIRGLNVQAMGGRACTNFADDTVLDGRSGSGALDIALGGSGSFVVNASDGEGNLLVFFFPKNANFFFDRSKLHVLNDGSIVYDVEGDGAAAAFGRSIDQSFVQAIRSVRYRLHVRRVCGVGEPVVGDFQGTFQLPDGSFRDLAGQFSFFRTF